jgi:predicted nucleotidyltransferase
MHLLVEERVEEVAALCRRFGVRQLDLFGSAAGDQFDPHRSDLDFLVVFENSSPGLHADRYLGLLEGLQDLFGRRVDLVELRAIRNPYFRRGVENTRTPLYAA